MAENSDKTARPTQAGSLTGELASLFGEQVLARSLRCDVADLEFSPDEIVQATRALRRLSGQPAAQVDLARGLPEDLQAALCKWIADESMRDQVLRARGANLQ